MADRFLLPGAPTTLIIDDGPYAGAEIMVRLDVPLGILNRVRRWMAEFRDTPRGTEEEARALQAAWDIFTDEALIGWNLADHRGDIPPDQSALERLPLPLLMEIVGTWAGSIGRVPPPLPNGSPPTVATPKRRSRRK